jgi:EmrB/QacA subfamily drug resistance transporter
MAFLDGTVVNIALPAVGRELHASMAGLQWVVDAYLLTLSAFVLFGGSLGDALGRRRIFIAGVVTFAATSALCGLAPSLVLLCVARALQGAAAALLVPNSLALVKASFRDEDQDAAVGAWAGLAGIAAAVGPLLGGWLVTALSWRSIFFINLPIALAAVLAARRCLHHDPRRPKVALDWTGAGLAAAALATLVYALIEGPARGWRWLALACGAVASATSVAFLLWERRARAPMLPLALFRRRQFGAANLATLAIYFGLSGATFLIPVALQHGLGYTPLGSSLILLPMAAILLVLSPLSGRLAHRIGYRLPMTAGPICAGLGLLLVAQGGLAPGRERALLAGISVFSVGLGLTVAPLTAAVLKGVEDPDTGIAAAANNAVARVAGLLGVAILPAIGGVSLGAGGEAFLEAVRAALIATAAVCAAGGIISWLGVPARAGGAA